MTLSKLLNFPEMPAITIRITIHCHLYRRVRAAHFFIIILFCGLKKKEQHTALEHQGELMLM